MKKLYLATTIVSVVITPGSLIQANRTRHQDIVWGADEEEARRLVQTKYAEGTDPERTTISIWLREALGTPIEDQAQLQAA